MRVPELTRSQAATPILILHHLAGFEQHTTLGEVLRFSKDPFEDDPATWNAVRVITEEGAQSVDVGNATWQVLPFERTAFYDGEGHYNVYEGVHDAQPKRDADKRLRDSELALAIASDERVKIKLPEPIR